MAELKTKKTEVSVESFINKVADAQQREDSYKLLEIMGEITGFPPKMWGPSIIGFGEYHYKYESGHEGDCCLIGFSPRKGSFSLYVMPGVENYQPELKSLGKHKTGKACLYVKKLADIDMAVLREIIQKTLKHMSDKGQQNKRAEPVTKRKVKAKVK